MRRLGGDSPLSYREYLAQFYNLIPGKTLIDYLRAPYRPASGLRRVLMNYAGNLLLFVPWGVLFPAAFRLRKRRFLILSAIVILCFELTQYFAQLGFFDIEDLLLNLAGAMLGYEAWRIAARKTQADQTAARQ